MSQVEFVALVSLQPKPYARAMASTGRPTVFVSSTVFDFRDLRSALKYWLTELGYDPRLSDFNDFPKPLDTNSYDACLQTIADADYFVLLIGSRVGGWYSEPEKISITRQEYRHAYDSFVKTGKPRIVTFVRSDVWNVKDDRADLAKLLEKEAALQKDVPPDVAAKITNASSRHVNDGEAIFSFIDEVKRKDEMIAATRKGQGFPPGNWVHTFNSFEDIIDVLRVEARAGSVRRAAIVAGLRSELQANASHLLRRQLTGWHALHEYVTPEIVAAYYAAMPKEPTNVKIRDAWIGVDGDGLRRLAAFSILSGSLGDTMLLHAVDAAIRSGVFLRWEASVHAFVPTVVQKALVRLRDEVLMLRRNESLLRSSEQTAQAHTWNTAPAPPGPVVVGLYELLPIIAVRNRHENILRLIATLLASLFDGNDARLSSLRLWTRSNLTTRLETIEAGGGYRSGVVTWLADYSDALATAAAAPSSRPPEEMFAQPEK